MSTSTIAANFQSTQLFFKRGDAEATFEDLPVPGIGPAGQTVLSDGNENFAGGITNAAQIVGYFLRLNGDKVKMRELLVDKCGCHGPSVDKAGSGTLAALEAKCEGFIAAEADESAPPAFAANSSTTTVMAAFQSKQMSWQDTFDSNPLPGLGPVGRAKLKEIDGIDNAAQLVGLFMTYNGDQDEFSDHLLECRIRRQDIENDNGILHAITEKLAAFCLPSLESDDEDPLSSDDEAELAERERMLIAGASAAEEARENDQRWRAQGGSVGSSLRASHAFAGSSDGGGKRVQPEPEPESQPAAGSGWAKTVARKRSAAAATEVRAAEDRGGGWAATKARQQAKAAAKATTQPVTVTPGISSKGLESDSIGMCRMLVYLAILATVCWIANNIGLIEL